MDKLKVGNKVEIVNYGHEMWASNLEEFQKFNNFLHKISWEFDINLLWGAGKFIQKYKDKDFIEIYPILKTEENGMIWYDRIPDLVGKQGIIWQITVTQDKLEQALEGVPSKSACYNREQLKLIE